MKTLITITLIIASFSSFAQARVLTTAEKVALVQSAEFQNECYAAVVDYANYWSAHDGSGFSTASERIEWAKNRQLGVHVLTKGISYGNAHEIFANYFSTLSVEYGSTPTTSDIITALLEDSVNRFEQAAAHYFKIWGDEINMSVGGN